MNQILRMIAVGGTVAALALSATPASAATPTQQSTAQAKILRPLTISWVSDFNLGTIVLSGAAPFSTTVGLNRTTGALTCDTSKVTCSGTTSLASYNVRGSNNQVVAITAPNVTLTNGTGDQLTLTVSAPPTVTLTSSGAPGNDFSIGGSITVSNTTPDGLYSGTFAVTADYQ